MNFISLFINSINSISLIRCALSYAFSDLSWWKWSYSYTFNILNNRSLAMKYISLLIRCGFSTSQLLIICILFFPFSFSPSLSLFCVTCLIVSLSVDYCLGQQTAVAKVAGSNLSRIFHVNPSCFSFYSALFTQVPGPLVII